MVDFIDFGCGTGGSIDWDKNRFGGDNYIGIDNRLSNVQIAINKGYNVILGDITNDNLKLPQSRYITMLHFLEHLKNEQEVEKVIKKSIELSTEFIFIKVPFFDGNDYLKELGFKLTWTDWIGHPVSVTSNMLKKICEKFELQYNIGNIHPIKDSFSNEIVPYSAPVDTIYYEEKLGQKNYIKFDNIYRETYCFVNINCQYWEELKMVNIL